MSGTEAQWIVPPRTEATILDQLLKNRGIQDPARYFEPNFERDSHDPFLLPSMREVVARITRAIERKEQIVVFADYDADGIPGGALLYKLLVANEARVRVYIPDRLQEGYGLNQRAIEALHQQGTTLIITVDLGITNQAEVAHAQSLGIDVIITDHHSIDAARLPTDAFAIVHPRLSGSSYPYGELAGGGVAWKLAQALASITGKPETNQLKWWLELAAISTICDLVPLTGENRTIAHFGLKVLQRSKNVGLRALYRSGSIAPERINSHAVGFQIGPRINAPGRIHGATTAFELLTTEDPVTAAQLAEEIERQNTDRKVVLTAMVDEALLQVAATKELPPIITVIGDQWSVGLAGLAASRIVEATGRPAIVLCGDGAETLKGSARSIPALDVVTALSQQRPLLTSFGGHAQAAGLSLERRNLASFVTSLNQIVGQMVSEEDFLPTFTADIVVRPDEVTEDLITISEKFQPFGVSNPRPSFIVDQLTVANLSWLGNQRQHAKFLFKETAWSAMGFRFDAHRDRWKQGSPVRVLGHFEWNEWQGNRTMQCILRDVQLSDNSTMLTK